LNVPYPADFGGVFDLFYKLPVLQKLGVKIYLHCFEYGRGEQSELAKYCVQVYYYKRKTGVTAFSFKLPYIVSSRGDEGLLDRLLQDDYPILMEGVHCTYLLNDARFADRKLFVRLHNVEHIYYRHLYKTTTSFLRKYYSLIESNQLLKYEKSIAGKAVFLAVSQKDVDDYKKLGCKQVSFLPVFLPDWKVDGIEGKGSYCLYHGNLEISENERAVKWLIKNVFNDLKLPLVIAGKNPRQKLRKLTEETENICLVANPSETEMQDIISKAHINIIPSFNATGIKLKLINALYNGRHVVGNTATVEGTGLEITCTTGDTADELKRLIKQLYDQPFTNEEVAKREALLCGMFNNEANAEKLIKIVWEDVATQEQ
jgi:hypothetical protein